MLPKHSRVDTRTIQTIFKEGKFLISPHLTFKFIQTNNLSPARISFIAPKSAAKLAVTRNKLRRLGYTALTATLKAFPHGIVGAFIFKKNQKDVSVLTHEIQSILAKIH